MPRYRDRRAPPAARVPMPLSWNEIKVRALGCAKIRAPETAGGAATQSGLGRRHTSPLAADEGETQVGGTRAHKPLDG